MRGAVSLAAALALPLATDAGADFPNRELIIFCAFSVILATLLIQGLTPAAADPAARRRRRRRDARARGGRTPACVPPRRRSPASRS